jgi:hypothetical protein
MLNSSKDASQLKLLLIATKDVNGEREEIPLLQQSQLDHHSSPRSSATQLRFQRTLLPKSLSLALNLILLLSALSQLAATGLMVKN